MTRLVERVEIPLDRGAAFRYIADFAHQAEWDPNTVSSRRVDESPLGTGSRFALEIRLGRRMIPMAYRITEYRPPSRVVLVGEGPGIWTEDAIDLAEIPGGTRVDYVADIRLDGLLGLLQPLLGRAMARVGRGAVLGMRRELDRLASQTASDRPVGESDGVAAGGQLGPQAGPG